MPKGMERQTAKLYRLVFVNLRHVADRLAAELSVDANVLDIGGGDGELLNLLLAARPDLRVTMVDIAPSVGKFLEPRHRDKVSLQPATPVETHSRERPGYYDAAIISDVMHHVPPTMRVQFLTAVAQTLKPAAPLFVKDIEPNHPIASLSLFADRNISGDKNAKLISMQQLQAVATEAGLVSSSELGLISVDRPNYLVKLSQTS